MKQRGKAAKQVGLKHVGLKNLGPVPNDSTAVTDSPARTGRSVGARFGRWDWRGERRGRMPIAVASGLAAAALPPWGGGVLGFLAPIGFLWVCLPKRPCVGWKFVFLCGLLQWMITFHFIRLPHWAGWIGWPLMGAYFALYNVALVSLTRRLIHRAQWPPLAAFPVVWVALEWIRSTLLTGLPIGLLGHSLYRQPFWIQTADLAGELTVTFLMVVVAAGATQILAAEMEWSQSAGLAARFRRRVVGAWALLLGLGVMAGYGGWAFGTYSSRAAEDGSEIAATNHALTSAEGEAAEGEAAEGEAVVGAARMGQAELRVGLVQGAQDVRFGLSVEEMIEEARASYRAHQSLTLQARRVPVDVVVWAESMFPATDVLPLAADGGKPLGGPFDPLGGEGDDAATSGRPSRAELERVREELPWQVRETTGTGPADLYPFPSGIPLIVGMRSYDPLADQDFNAAVQFDEQGEVAGRYFKTHLVPFGEYLPAGDWFPQLYQLAPMARGLTPGSGAALFEIQGRRLVPTICYESVMGDLVRRYLVAVKRSDRQPDGSEWPADQSRWDALLNLSNDGWFWGSNALDLHLASNVFRAVENRTTHLVVCNTGISAEIAANGVILQQANKREVALIVTKVSPRPASWEPLWWQVGNGPWWICTGLAGWGLARSFRRQPTPGPGIGPDSQSDSQSDSHIA